VAGAAWGPQGVVGGPPWGEEEGVLLQEEEEGVGPLPDHLVVVGEVVALHQVEEVEVVVLRQVEEVEVVAPHQVEVVEVEVQEQVEVVVVEVR